MEKNRINKPKLNLIIDLLMFFVLLAITGIGFLIKYLLIPGFKRNEIYGKDVELYFLGLDRHQWGNIHLVLGFVLVLLLFLHIIFHWKLIVCLFNKFVLRKNWRTIITASSILAIFLFGIMPFMVKPEIREGIPHKKHQKVKINNKKDGHQYSSSINEMTDSLTLQDLTKNEQNKSIHKKKHHKSNESQSVEVYGYMTLNEVAKKYNISVNELAEHINVPENTSNNKLGQLRRKYGFHMDDLREYIKSKL